MSQSTRMPLRVLHVVGNMNRGGTETWLMHMLRRIDPARVRMDFLVSSTADCHFAAEIESLGGKLLACEFTPRGLLRDLPRLNRFAGPYDVLHCHMQFFNAFALMAGWRSGIPTRISHSHLAVQQTSEARTNARQIYQTVSPWVAKRFATHLVGCSADACHALFGPAWRRNPRCRTLYCGLDFSKFHQRGDRVASRKRLGIAPDDFVIGHVGRFCSQKNQKFLLPVMAQLLRQVPQARLLLVGHGPDRKAICQDVDKYGLKEQVLLLEASAEVPSFMTDVMDVFVFPSLFEGLGLALVEAQAAGLPCVISSRVPHEADIVPTLVHRLSIDDGTTPWVDTLLSLVRQSARVKPAMALQQVLESPFNVETSIMNLMKLYGVAEGETRFPLRQAA